MDCIIKNSALECTVSTRGAEIQSVKGNRCEYIWQADERYWGKHAPLLFPICGRLKNSQYTLDGKLYEMGSHGFLKFSEFEVVEKSDNSLTLYTESTPETKAIYPFDFSVKAEYKLDNCKLLCTYTIKNLSDRDMPYSFGLHPGFNLFCDGDIDIEDYALRFDTPFITSHKFTGFAEKKGERLDTVGGVHKISEEEIYSNDTLILSDMGNRVSLFTDKSSHQIDLEFSENLKHFCVWKCPEHDAKYICLEPWTTIPTDPGDVECFNNRYGMLTLGKGQTQQFTLNVDFHS